ncbi:MAG: AzlD domain-containing protein [Brevibacillus sp.]|nr:AzlD domain-containing protein [Brevibacillus sp.]
MNDKLVLYILLMAVITYLTRFPMLLVSSRVRLPGWLSRALKLVPVGVFSSLTIPPILFHVREGSWSPEYLAAAAAAFVAACRTRQIFAALLVGVAAVVCWRYLL